jgi:TorA maturation chaperone TorD
MIDEMKEELYLYNFLRRLFLKEPAKEFLAEIRQIELPADADDSFSEGLRVIVEEARVNADRLDEWADELGIEYARLFIGPVNPPAIPYASFYLSESRSLMTDETIDVRKRYLEAGVAVKELYSTPDDHIGIELEFICDLTRRIIELSAQANQAEASRLLDIRERFLNEHFSKWVPAFADRIIAAAKTDFYKTAAFLLKESF